MIDRKKLAVRTCALLRRKNNYRDRDCMLKGNYAGIQEKRELLESNGDNWNEVLVHLLVPINDWAFFDIPAFTPLKFKNIQLFYRFSWFHRVKISENHIK